jgi:hypothetical protein
VFLLPLPALPHPDDSEIISIGLLLCLSPPDQDEDAGCGRRLHRLPPLLLLDRCCTVGGRRVPVTELRRRLLRSAKCIFNQADDDIVACGRGREKSCWFWSPMSRWFFSTIQIGRIQGRRSMSNGVFFFQFFFDMEETLAKNGSRSTTVSRKTSMFRMRMMGGRHTSKSPMRRWKRTDKRSLRSRVQEWTSTMSTR